MKTWYAMKTAANAEEAEICIFSEIGFWGVTAQQFANDLKALGNVKTLNIKINSPGGSVIDGTMIFNLLASHAARKVVDILGWAASMASVIAMAGDVVRMPANTYLMIHNPWMSTAGDAEQLRKDADLLDKMRNGILGAYRRKAKTLSDDEIVKLMDAETWMTAAEAKGFGFADEITGEIEIAAKVDADKFGFGKIPDAAAKWMGKKEITKDANGKTDEPKGDEAGKAGGSEQTDSGAGSEDPVGAGAAQDPSAPGIDAAALVTTLNAKIDALNSKMADMDAAKSAAESKIADLDGIIKGNLEALAVIKEENTRRSSEAQGRFDKLTHDYNSLAERHSRLVGGGLVFEADCESWPDALVKCAGDYVEARKRYPLCFTAYMDAQREKSKK